MREKSYLEYEVFRVHTENIDPKVIRQYERIGLTKIFDNKICEKLTLHPDRKLNIGKQFAITITSFVPQNCIRFAKLFNIFDL